MIVAATVSTLNIYKNVSAWKKVLHFCVDLAQINQQGHVRKYVGCIFRSLAQGILKNL